MQRALFLLFFFGTATDHASLICISLGSDQNLQEQRQKVALCGGPVREQKGGDHKSRIGTQGGSPRSHSKGAFHSLVNRVNTNSTHRWMAVCSYHRIPLVFPLKPHGHTQVGTCFPLWTERCVCVTCRHTMQLTNLCACSGRG